MQLDPVGVSVPPIREAGDALAAEFVDVSDGVWTASPAVIDTVRRLQAALEAGGVALTRHFAATAAHFEGQGTGHVFDQVENPKTAAALKALDELPDPD